MANHFLRACMKEKKRKVVRIFLGIEIAFITLYYLLSSFGLQALRSADHFNNQLVEDIKNLEAEVGSLSQELEDRKNNPFYKEAVARKELQMAYENEIIYLIDKKALDIKKEQATA